MKATRMIMLTDVIGVLDLNQTLISELTLKEAGILVDKKIVSGGMIPKIQTCISTVNSGAEAAVILDGRLPHAVLLEVLTDEGVGTMIS